MVSSRNFLGPYQLVRLIRAGQRCNVWEVLRQGKNERVAIKVLLEEHKHKKIEIDQLRHEAMVGEDLEHPSVIKIFEFVSRYDLPFIVMQLFNARNLKQAIREHPEFLAINIPDIIRRCAEGMEHLHGKGWLHCDLKPDNYLVDERGTLN